MREAFLTGGTDGFDATDIPETEAVSTGPVFIFESVTLTEEGRLKLVGTRYFGEATEEFTLIRYRAPHPDLLLELRRLTLHMALLTEHVSETQLYPVAPLPALAPDVLQELYPGILPAAMQSRNALRDAIESGEAYLHELLEPYRCLSVAWKSKGVVLSGIKKTRYRFGKDLELKTPVTLVMSALDEEAEENDYAFFEPMSNALEHLRSECMAYLNGKYGEGGEQLELFGKDAPAPTLSEAIDIMDEALHADQLRRDARENGGLFGGTGSLGRIHDLVNDNNSGFTSVEFSVGKTGEAPQVVGKIEKRPAKRKAVKGEQQNG